MRLYLPVRHAQNPPSRLVLDDSTTCSYHFNYTFRLTIPRIQLAFIHFNYDGYVNGSDYTLIDNAYNTQGPAISSEVASTTAEIAGVTASVPEPASVALLACGSVCLLRRRRRARAAVH